ncbi:hypothetical protein E2C01_082801 [Portunus trituberculatus]|uniref:Uncharacterized protein n=1 Tax=Portunus trituberculatus TaxID=210409 RepID=A0A5B7J027_PORTR|nr:hypothetical protein [Portunus trituberculatus]
MFLPSLSWHGSSAFGEDGTVSGKCLRLTESFHRIFSLLLVDAYQLSSLPLPDSR